MLDIRSAVLHRLDTPLNNIACYPVGPQVHMDGTGFWRSLVVLALATNIGCNPRSEPTAVSDPASLSQTGTPSISGSVFRGTGTRNICSVLPHGSELLVRSLTEDGTFFTTFETCPDNQFFLEVTPGKHFLRLILSGTPDLGLIPQRWLEPVPVTVEADNVVKDAHVRNGSPLHGGATLDGDPLPGLGVTVLYGNLPFAGAGFAVSGPNGVWMEDFGRSPPILQSALDYIFRGCEGPVPGVGSISGFPAGPVRFPGHTNEVNCDMTTGNALRFTHRATRLKLTSFPGDIGGLSEPVIFPNVGYGYSAQFPLPPRSSPRAGPDLANRQLFRGGLVVGIGQDLLLGGTETAGYISCEEFPCRDLGLDGRAMVTGPLAGGRREITWDYTDGESPQSVGLHVQQKSFDGMNGADYVLYVFRILNEGANPVTVTPGLFLDFDVLDIARNIGHTALNGRLMVTTSAEEQAHQLGSVVLQSPGGRNFFINLFNPQINEGDAVMALRGLIKNPSAGPADIATLHGGATVRLGRGSSTDFWAAVVAGDNPPQVIANARAAIADANARKARGDPFGSLHAGAKAIAWEKVESRGARAKAMQRGAGPRCKTGCRPE